MSKLLFYPSLENIRVKLLLFLINDDIILVLDILLEIRY